MSDSDTFNLDLAPLYETLGNSLGAFVIDPGETPFIVLHNSLKGKQDPTAQLVYQSLLKYYKALPPAYFLFPHTKFYEDLPQVVDPPLVVFARAPRRWGYAAYYPDDFRLIG